MKPPMKKMGPPTKTREAPKKTPAKAPMPGVAHMPEMPEDMAMRARDALHTLKRAHEIKQDGALMDHVRKHAANERNILGSIARRKT